MTREEAITWFENRAKQITLSGAREMYRLAISALRELDEYKKAEAEGRQILKDLPIQGVSNLVVGCWKEVIRSEP